MKLNTVILADDSASCNIADLCVLLKERTVQQLEEFTLSNSCVDIEKYIYLSDSISKLNVSEKMSLINSDCSICFWYGHGKADSFCIENEPIITTTENHYVFSNALIYTFSCLNGGELADTLVANNVKAFVGYTNYANCPYGIDDVTSSIVMTFIKSFLSGKTVHESKEALSASYEDAIFNEDLEPFQRSQFQSNRDGLIVKGNGNLCIRDMLIG